MSAGARPPEAPVSQARPMDDDLFLSQRHPISRRTAIVADDGRAGWLYLTAPDDTHAIADCWL